MTLVSPGTHVSPGFNPRPSLSDRHQRKCRPLFEPVRLMAYSGVAGVQPPAFVERRNASRVAGVDVAGDAVLIGVAGVQPPAFVERPLENCRQ